MNQILTDQLEKLHNSGTHLHLSGALHGIEKEGLRVDSQGNISLTPHPMELGSSLTNGYITTDFSESLLELITPALTSPAAALHFLEAIHQYTYSHLGEELIWASSMPCRIEDSSSIPIAQFGTSNIGQMKHIYRVGLMHRYGKMMQSIAGIHYNFSLPDDFWNGYQELLNNQDSMKSFVSSAYFSMIRNFRRHSWLLMFLFGASPALSRSFLGEETKNLEPLYDDTLFLPYATSLRMSDLGYSSTAQSSLKICFNQLKTYTKTLAEAMNTPHPSYEKIGVFVDGEYRQLSDTVLQIENEYYSDIRPKRVPDLEESALQALKRGGVQYIEIRSTDVNPLLPVGIDLEQAAFMDTFLIGCLLMGDEFISQEECRIIADNHKKVATRGREPQLLLSGLKGDVALKSEALQLINQFGLVAGLLDQLHKTDLYSRSIKAQLNKVEDPSLTPSAQVVQSLKTSDLNYNEWVLETSKKHKQTFINCPQDIKLQEQLSMESKDSVAKQSQIEASESVDFDTFMRMYRTRNP
ncbi:MAG: glutamate--cysteine ligase [Desulfocapsaceae bacterium]